MLPPCQPKLRLTDCNHALTTSIHSFAMSVTAFGGQHVSVILLLNKKTFYTSRVSASFQAVSYRDHADGLIWGGKTASDIRSISWACCATASQLTYYGALVRSHPMAAVLSRILYTINKWKWLPWYIVPRIDYKTLMKRSSLYLTSTVTHYNSTASQGPILSRNSQKSCDFILYACGVTVNFTVNGCFRTNSRKLLSKAYTARRMTT